MKKPFHKVKTINAKNNIINNKHSNQKNKKKNLKFIPYSSLDIFNIKKTKDIKFNEITILNDEELNSLEYELALSIDKRTYFQYYFSLIKKKQLILFTFFLSNDYNLKEIKISLFLLIFSFYFTINGFFFTDESMHNLYKSNGKFDILYQISQIIYSSIIPSVINTILKYLSLSERNILKLKKVKKVNDCFQKSKGVENCLKIQFIIFFILGFLIMYFFWFFISCFCAVYKNTQIILIEDTLISFGISMLYPFGINILPGLFRIPALRKKNRNCLYKISLFISII